MYFFLGLSTLFNVITSIVVSLVTYQKSRENPSILAKIFIFQSLLIGLWALLYFFPFFPQNYHLTLVSFHALHVGSNFITVTHLLLVSHLLNIFEAQKKIIYLGYLWHTFLLVFIPTRFFIEDVVPKFDFYYWAQVGPMYHVWVLSWSFFMLWSTWLLIKHYRKTKGLKKQQIKGFLIGTLIGLVSGSANFLPFYNIDFPYYLNALASLYVCTIAYMIARYRFFNAKLNFLRFIHSTLSFALACVSLYAVYLYLDSFLLIERGLQTDIIFLIAALLLYHFYEVILSQKRMSHLMRLSDYEQFCNTVRGFIRRYKFDDDLGQLRNRLYRLFVKDLDLSTAELCLVNDPCFKELAELKNYWIRLKKKNEVIIYSELELRAQASGKPSELLMILRDKGEVFVPILSSKNKLLGILILGKKPFDNPFYIEEIEQLKNAAHYISQSLAVINYHSDLAKDVQRKTRVLRHKNKELKSSYEQLKELDNVKDEFLSIASHELRTPLTIIKGYTDFLRAEQFGSLNKKQKEFSEKILRNTNDLIEMINCMLDISRLESGLMSFDMKSLDLVSFIKDLQKEFKIIYQKKELTLSFSNREKLTPKVLVDKEKLVMVLTNLLGNAYKFTPAKGKVSITLEVRKKQVVIGIADNGIGIPLDKQSLIFKKFQQADNPMQKTYAGSGLGLNITRQIIKKFGGKIWVESEGKIKKGSVFYFTLPLHEA